MMMGKKNENVAKGGKLLIPIALLALAVPARATDNWVFIGPDPQGSLYYLNRSSIEDHGSYVTAWIRSELSDFARSQVFRQAAASHVMGLYGAAKGTKQTKIFQLSLYDRNGNVIRSSNSSGQWQYYTPNTVEEVIWKALIDAAQVAQAQPAPRPSSSTPSSSRPSSATPSSPSSSSSRPSSSSSRPSSSSSRSSSSSSSDYNWGLSVGVSAPVSEMLGNNDSLNIGFSVGAESGNGPLYLLLQGDYYAFNTQSLLGSAALGWQFVGNSLGLGLYAGGGLGAATYSGNFDDSHLAWKVFGGARFMFGPVSLRADVSYVSDAGVVLAAFAGIMF